MCRASRVPYEVAGVEQTVYERPDAVLGEVGVVVPSFEQAFNGEVAVLSDRDQCAS